MLLIINHCYTTYRTLLPFGTFFKSKLMHLILCNQLLRSKHESAVKNIKIKSPYEILSENEIKAFLRLLFRKHDTNGVSELASYKPVPSLISKLKECEKYMESLSDMYSDDKEMQDLVKKERELYKAEIKAMREKLLMCALTENAIDDRDAVIEISSAVGGAESKLFANELFDMYVKYITYKKWSITDLSKRNAEGGGIQAGYISVSGNSAFKYLQHEAGIHRVQRVPKTEKSGRMHTSTCRVIVMPQALEDDIEINSSDLEIETKHSSGAGGQHVNKIESCVRIKHLPTGIVVEDQTTRYQIQNRKNAFQKLRNALMNLKLIEKENEIKSLRNEQAGSADRSDKIRTYNFSRNAVTDHRLNITVSNVPDFMLGTEQLNEMISHMIQRRDEKRLINEIRRCIKSENVDDLFETETIT